MPHPANTPFREATTGITSHDSSVDRTIAVFLFYSHARWKKRNSETCCRGPAPLGSTGEMMEARRRYQVISPCVLLCWVGTSTLNKTSFVMDAGLPRA